MAWKIVGEFDMPKEADKDAEAKQFIKQVYAQLKAKKGKGLKLDIEAKTREEAANTVKKINGLIGHFGSSYKRMVVKLELAGDAGFEVSAELKPKSPAGKGKKIAAKGGNKASAIKSAAAAPAAAAPESQPAVQWLTKSIEERKNALLKAIESTPREAMPMVLDKNQEYLLAQQNKLAAAGIKEEEAARLKEEIKMTQEVIEFIKKKMGN